MPHFLSVHEDELLVVTLDTGFLESGETAYFVIGRASDNGKIIEGAFSGSTATIAHGLVAGEYKTQIQARVEATVTNVIEGPRLKVEAILKTR